MHSQSRVFDSTQFLLMLVHQSKTLSHSGVVRKSVFSEQGYSQYLCFNVIVGSNDLCVEQKYTEEQQRNQDLIKSLNDGGMGYQKIANYLNEQGIKTVRGNTWKNTQVFSVLKKFRERLERIENVRQFDHGVEISKFELIWIKDNE